MFTIQVKNCRWNVLYDDATQTIVLDDFFLQDFEIGMQRASRMTLRSVVSEMTHSHWLWGDCSNLGFNKLSRVTVYY